MKKNYRNACRFKKFAYLCSDKQTDSGNGVISGLPYEPQGGAMFEIPYQQSVLSYAPFVTGLNVPVTKQCGVCSKYVGYFGRTLREMERYRSNQKTGKHEKN